MKYYLEKLSRGIALSVDEAALAMELILMARAQPQQIAAFLALLHAKGETEDELFGFLSYMHKHVQPVHCAGSVLDTSGTGGDYAHTFNISTAAAILLASQGLRVLKHGGKSVSSACGSADVVDALGIPKPSHHAALLAMLEHTGFAFAEAQIFNPIFNAVKELRQQLGMRTCFNILGPLLNPVRVKRQVMGVYDKRLLRILPALFARLGAEEVMVVHARDGMDEFSLNAPTDVAHLRGGNVAYYTVDANDIGLNPAPLSAIAGGNAKDNATLIATIFTGAPSAYRDVVVFNAAAGFVVAGTCKTLREGAALAQDALDSGKCLEFLTQLRGYKDA